MPFNKLYTAAGVESRNCQVDLQDGRKMILFTNIGVSGCGASKEVEGHRAQFWMLEAWIFLRQLKKSSAL